MDASWCVCFSLHATATAGIYTLPLDDALPILVEHEPLDELRALLQQQMTEDVGIVKRNDRLEKALLNFKEIQKEVEGIWEVSRPTQELIELRNMIQVGILVTEAALEREENVGLHYKVE
mgnify:CR=1 FL=1